MFIYYIRVSTSFTASGFFLQNYKILPFLITFYHSGVKPPLLEMLFIVICAHWKWKGIITAFNLIIFFCLTTVYNIRFFKYSPLPCLFLCRIWLFKICYLKRLFCLLMKRIAFSSTHLFDCQERYIYYYIKRI